MVGDVPVLIYHCGLRDILTDVRVIASAVANPGNVADSLMITAAGGGSEMSVSPIAGCQVKVAVFAPAQLASPGPFIHVQ